MTILPQALLALLRTPVLVVEPVPARESYLKPEHTKILQDRDLQRVNDRLVVRLEQAFLERDSVRRQLNRAIVEHQELHREQGADLGRALRDNKRLTQENERLAMRVAVTELDRLEALSKSVKLDSENTSLLEEIRILRRRALRYEREKIVFSGSEKRKIAAELCKIAKVYYGSKTLRNRILSMLDRFLLE